MSAATLHSVRRALAATAADAAKLEIFGSDAEARDLPGVATRRRAMRRGAPDPVRRAALYLNPEGVLEWQIEAALPGIAPEGRRAGAPPDIPAGELADVFEFEPLQANAVGAFLERVDKRLNPHAVSGCRLRRLTPEGVQPLEALPRGKRRRLLFVHGTFSESKIFLDGFERAGGAGTAFLSDAFAQYDEVLVFEHATLSVSPVMNALDLQRELAGASGPLDIVAHSRGGLVTRWALEAFGLSTAPVRAVLVGSPLDGTSLASPARLKATLGLLSNFGTALQASGAVASAYLPLLLVPLAVLRVAASVAGVAARTPLLDGTIAMIPGLSAQSRVAGNPELTRLQQLPARRGIEYYAVTSDFQTSAPGWAFWKWFRARRIADAAADAVFPGANDLVVDTDSMTGIAPGLKGVLSYGTNPDVHHTNYFEQRRTLDFIRSRLGWR